jgi:hypothetical protein
MSGSDPEQIALLSSLLQSLPEPSDASPPAMAVERHLRDAASLPLPASARDLVEMLGRKVEVTRRLERSYDADRKSLGDAPVAAGYANLFCGLCILVFLQAGDHKPLNTALKLLDGWLLAPGVDWHPALLAAAEKALEQA